MIMNMPNKLNLKQPKYILPAILYFPLLGLGYLFIDIFHTEIAEEVNTELQTTEYLNAELPSANVKEGLGGKRENVEKTFGNIRDLSAMENIDNDLDSIKKKEDFSSNYTEKDLEELAKNASSQAERDRYNDMRRKLQEQAGTARDQSGAEFVKDISDDERAKIDELRRNNHLDDVEQALGNIRKDAAGKVADAQKQAEGEVARLDSLNDVREGINAKLSVKTKTAVTALDEDEEASSVVKKVREESNYFNTLSVNEKESSMIKAIVDEDIKAVDGSRVRLRLLDDIEINDVVLKKGSYLYCVMSGFGSQRVKGKVESVMVDDHLEKVSLSVYDLDGLEGLYVPESRFREAAKDVGGQALQSNMNVVDGMSTSTSFVSWASNAMQNGYQRVANAVSKNIRKNKAKIKYGTQVYLVNAAQKKGGGRQKGSTQSRAGADNNNMQYGTPPALRNMRTSGGSTVPRPSLRSYGQALGQ